MNSSETVDTLTKHLEQRALYLFTDVKLHCSFGLQSNPFTRSTEQIVGTGVSLFT